MMVINQASAGDHIGQIFLKNAKKGLYIDESKFLKKKETYLNKETVDHYEIVKDDTEEQQKGSLAKGVIGGATFGLAGALVGSSAKKTKTHHRYLVSVIFKDGTKALCELDDNYYEILLKTMY